MVLICGNSSAVKNQYGEVCERVPGLLRIKMLQAAHIGMGLWQMEYARCGGMRDINGAGLFYQSLVMYAVSASNT